MSGWVKVHRDFFDRWEWASDPNTVAVWIRLLIDARYEPGAYRGTPLEAGQVIVGRKALAEKTGLTEQQVRTALNHLKESGIITTKSTNKFSVVTVENWAVEQEFGNKINQQNGQKTATQQPANNHPATSHQPHAKQENKKAGKQGSNVERHTHGSYQNVLLTDDQLSTFQAEQPADWSRYIEELSEYQASTGKSYRDYLATLRGWAKRDMNRITKGVTANATNRRPDPAIGPIGIVL